MKKRNMRLLILAAMAASLMMPIQSQTAEAATVRADFNVNLRTAASAAAEKIGAVESGEIAELLGSHNGWFIVRHRGITGYSYPSFWSGNSVLSTSEANVRQTASPLGLVLDKIRPGTEVLITGRSGQWLYIRENGIKGFSHRSLWDISDELFAGLPHVVSDPVDLSGLNPLNIPEPEPPRAGDRYPVISDLPAYSSYGDAKSGEGSIGIQAPGTYVIALVRSGMIKVIQDPESAGVWIDPTDNTGTRSPDALTLSRKLNARDLSAQEPNVPDQNVPAATGDPYEVYSSLPGFIDAAGAARGFDPAVTVTPGAYFIFTTHRGMINVSTDRTVPGAWIDPAGNAQPTNRQPAPGPIVPISPIGLQVVEEAKKLLGAPYILGAESWEEGGFDCSGVTQFAYARLGVAIPRRAAQQWDGISQKVTQPLPGDIIAFEKDGRVYHVGIYIGEGQMIHAPKPGARVKISDLAWWYKNSIVKGFLRPVPD